MASALNIQKLITTVDESLTIPDSRNYWLIRTQSGTLYENFREHNFIALEYEEIGLSTISKLKKENPQEFDFMIALKAVSQKVYKDVEKARHGLIASQIARFVYEIKKNDVVIIPSGGGYSLSFGVITDTKIPSLTETQLAITGCLYKKRKNVKWLKEIPKNKIDPYLYKMLGSRMALSDVTPYQNVIERSLHNFFVTVDEGHLVLNVKTQENISAYELFQTGYFLLNFSKDFYKTCGIDIDLQSIDLKINLNSEGKMHMKAPKASTVWLIAIVAVALNGGGLKIEKLGLDISTTGIIQKVIDYQNNAHDRAMQDALKQNFNHLKVESPDDALKLLQQSATNKNKPK